MNIRSLKPLPKTLTRLLPHRLALIMLTLACAAHNVSAQQPRYYSLKEGLQSTSIYTMYVDKTNFLWVSTLESLELFDGNTFHTINCENRQTGKRLFDTAYEVRQMDDRHFWVATNLGLFLFDRSTNEFSRIKLSPDEKERGFSVTQILDYPDRDLAILPSDGYGVFIINKKTREVDTKRSQLIAQLIGDPYVTEMFIDSKKRIWAHAFSHVLHAIDTDRKKVTAINFTPRAASLLQQCYVTHFAEDARRGKIFMGLSQGGILVWDEATRTLRELSGASTDFLYVRTLTWDADGRLLVGTDGQGLWEIDPAAETCARMRLPSISWFNANYSKVHSIAVDTDGNLLIGMYQRGLMVIPHQTGGFAYTTLSVAGDDKNTSCVTSFAEAADEHLFAGTDGSGVFTSGPTTGDGWKPIAGGLSSPLVQTLAIDKRGTLWCGTWQGGLQQWDGNAWHTPQYMETLKDMSVMSLAYDKTKDLLYIATNGHGIYSADLTEQKLRRVTSTANSNIEWVSKIFLDSEGLLWIADATDNYCCDPRAGKTVRIDTGDEELMMAQAFAEYDKKTMLLGTRHGLLLVDRQTKKLVGSDMTRLTADMQIKTIETTKRGIWIATNRGLARIDRGTGRLTTLRSPGGYDIGEIHHTASARLRNGNILIGGDNGFVSFNPQEVVNRHTNIKPVKITGLRIGGEEIDYKPQPGADNMLDAAILAARDVRLPRGDNSFFISFSTPEMGEPERVNYSYTLQGYESDWHTIESSSPQAYYASVPPGNYTFRVRAHFEESLPESAGDGQKYTEATLNIHIPAPWYATVWAYMAYAAIAAIIAILTYRNIRGRQRARAKLRESMHKEQTKEAQLRLFTSIAHELRSPLTMVISPLKQLMKGETDRKRMDSYNLMQRNCNRILSVVNQITDVRKIDNGQFRLHFKEVELNAYAKNILSSFLGMASAKGITITTHTDEDKIMVWIDPTHFEKVIANILSNALKFTPKQGHIDLRTSCHAKPAEHDKPQAASQGAQYLEIAVYNSGSHIKESDLAHVYERFYQSSSTQSAVGSGIGLNLADELVKLHHGTISVRNMEPDGVEFTIRIPLGNKHLTKEELADDKPEDNLAISLPAPDDTDRQDEAETVAAEASDGTETDSAAKKTGGKKKANVLLVDDNEELLDYIQNELKDSYNVTTATSGNKGWELVTANRPDIVVTDLMMPDGDGYDLCRRIKGNPETDYIAIIVLTSESGEDNHLRTMDLQADHFLTKPFNILILKSALTQVLNVRDNYRKKMQRNEMGGDYTSVAISSTEDKLAKRVYDSIMKHLDDTDFSVETLSAEAGISRVHLNRKLKQIYGLSPSAYIRSIRLKQAAYLLVNNRVSVSEVAYRVGFSSPSYFSSDFREFFGMSPKEFAAYYSDDAHGDALKKLLE